MTQEEAIPTAHPDTLLSAPQIALLLDCSVHTVYRLWKSGKLPKHETMLCRSRSRWADVQALGWIPQRGKGVALNAPL